MSGGGFFDALFGDDFLDFNGDGKVDFSEEYLGWKIFEDTFGKKDDDDNKDDDIIFGHSSKFSDDFDDLDDFDDFSSDNDSDDSWLD